MAITLWTPGDAITATRLNELTAQINTNSLLMTRMLAAEESTNSATPSDVTGMSFPVVSGRIYTFRVLGQYACAATNQGIGIGTTTPGGSNIGIWRIMGPSSATTEVLERTSTSGTGDTMTASATVNAGGTTYQFEAQLTYVCTSSGVYTFRKQRNGSSNTTGLTLRAGMSVICHASAI